MLYDVVAISPRIPGALGWPVVGVCFFAECFTDMLGHFHNSAPGSQAVNKPDAGVVTGIPVIGLQLSCSV